MYCNVVVPVVFEDKEVAMVVTDLYHQPASSETWNSPPTPAYVEVQGGYVLSEGGKELDFYDVLEVNMKEVHEACLSWYNSEEDRRDYD